MENITYIKPLHLSVIEFQKSSFSFAFSKFFLFPSAFAFCKAERKGEGDKPVQTVHSTTAMSNVAYIDRLPEEKLKLRFGLRV